LINLLNGRLILWLVYAIESIITTNQITFYDSTFANLVTYLTTDFAVTVAITVCYRQL